MRMSRYLIFALVICLAALAGCNKENLPESKNGNLPSKDGVEIHFQHKTYPASVKKMVLEIKNNGSKAISYDVKYQIEKWQDGKWDEVPLKKDMGWSTIAFPLKPNESGKLTISTDALKEPLTKGKYRIVKKFYASGTNQKIIKLAAPFEVE